MEARSIESRVEQVGEDYVIRRVYDGDGYGARSITCTVCGMTSWHTEDIARRYCANCHAFHDDRALARRIERGDAP